MKDQIIQAIKEANFHIVYSQEQMGRSSVSVSYEDMSVSENTKAFLRRSSLNSLWRHQRLAVEKALCGNNICISTSTSSGKTEIFPNGGY